MKAERLKETPLTENEFAERRKWLAAPWGGATEEEDRLLSLVRRLIATIDADRVELQRLRRIESDRDEVVMPTAKELTFKISSGL